MWGVVRELAPMVEVWGTLLAEHQPDEAGMCRRCTRGGTGIPAVVWPCPLYVLADQARGQHVPVDGGAGR